MADFDPEEMTPGLSAFIVAFFGGGLIVMGFLMSILFPPAGVILFVLGALFLFLSPVIGVLAWLDQRGEDDDV